MRPLISTFSLTLALLLAVASIAILDRIHADTRPAIEINVNQAVPWQVDEVVEQAVTRDYGAAWQALASALASNNSGVLNDNFVGFALDKLTQRVKDQQRTGLKTRMVDRGHKVDAVFYSPEGSAIELRDLATVDLEIFDGETVIHSEHVQLHYYAVMTGAEDRWKVRVLESAK
jgi:hypothetical protein